MWEFSNRQSKKDKTSMKLAGCVSGIFQLFDPRRLLSSRRLSGQDHKKNAPGLSQLSLGKVEADYSELCHLEKNLSSSYRENSSSWMESSSRTSFSSSSKSFSSLEHRSRQDELRFSEQSFLSGTPPTNTSRPWSPDTKQSPGLRDIVTKEKDCKINKVLKPMDSPRPIVDLSKFKDLEESLKILIKLKELPKEFIEVNGSPRYSYDGREILQATKDIKHAAKQKEHRRLSLDSMEDSRMRDFNSKFNSLVKELKGNNNHRGSEASNLLQCLQRNENHPSIVAKLMGLEPINPSKRNNSKGYDRESKKGKSLLSPTNSPKSQRSINQHMKSNSSSGFVIEETQQKMAVGSIEVSMKQKIESVYSVKEKALQRLQFQHNNKEISRKSSGDLNFRSRSLSPQIIQPTSKLEKKDISGALRSPIVVIKPASKSAGTSSSQFAKLEGPSALRKIRTIGSSNRKEESSMILEEQTPTTKTGNCFLKAVSKETSRREESDSLSPSLQKRKHDQEKKSGTMILSHDLKKTQRQPGNRPQSQLVSPRFGVRPKPSKAQDNEGNSHSFQQPKGKSDTKRASKHKQHQMISREVLYAKELEKVAPPLSSPNSVLDPSLYQDDLPLSPLSVSSISNAEDVNLASDHNFKMMHLPPTLPSKLCFGADSQKSEILDTIPCQFLVLGTTIDDPPATKEISLILENHCPENKYVAELLLESGLLSKDPHTLAMLEKISPVESSVIAENSNTKMLRRRLVYDVVNEILARKKEAFDSGLLELDRLSAQLIVKEICLEISCLQSCRDGLLQDKDSAFTTDLLRRLKAWDRFESEVPDIVLEIEKLVFADLINEIVSSVSAVVLESKDRHRRLLFS